MPDIVLRIHSKGQDPHEITAPDDIVTEEFLTELVKGLRLPQSDEKGLPIVWEADDKDNGQLLAPGRSLAANGVRAGHNIYLRQKAVSPPVIPPPITKPTAPPHAVRTFKMAVMAVTAADSGSGSSGILYR